MKKYLTEYIIALFVLLVLCANVFAVSISVPDSVEVKDAQTSFFVDITNESNELLPVTINFYSTTKTSVVAQKTISPHSTITAKIIVNNDAVPNYHEIESKIEVYVGKQFTQKNITLKFLEKEKLVQTPQKQPTQQVPIETNKDTNKIDTNNSNEKNVLVGFNPIAWFGAGQFAEETNDFTIIDWIIFWFLVIIAAILVIAFIARVVKRV